MGVKTILEMDIVMMQTTMKAVYLMMEIAVDLRFSLIIVMSVYVMKLALVVVEQLKLLKLHQDLEQLMEEVLSTFLKQHFKHEFSVIDKTPLVFK